MLKDNPNNLTKKIVKYGALSMAIAAIANVNGQIVYTDLIPDEVGPNNRYFIDFNNDLYNDVLIAGSSRNTNSGVTFNSLVIVRANLAPPYPSVLGTSVYLKYPFALDEGAPISAGRSSWVPLGPSTAWMNYRSCEDPGSNWCDVIDKYLGLRFDIDGVTHYGWARLDVTLDANWVLKDYAYNASVAGTGRDIHAEGAPIIAGEGRPTQGVTDNVFTNVKITTLNKSITLFNLPQKTDYSLFSLTGQSVLNGNIDGNIHVIEAGNVATGVYILELQDGHSKAILRNKIIL